MWSYITENYLDLGMRGGNFKMVFNIWNCYLVLIQIIAWIYLVPVIVRAYRTVRNKVRGYFAQLREEDESGAAAMRGR